MRKPRRSQFPQYAEWSEWMERADGQTKLTAEEEGDEDVDDVALKEEDFDIMRMSASHT